MSEYIASGDVVRFGVVTHHYSGWLQAADALPQFVVYTNNGDTIAARGVMSQRANETSGYRSWILASPASGINVGDYAEIHVSGIVGGRADILIVKSFVLDDVYKANITQVNGANVALSNTFDANVVSVDGSSVILRESIDANLTYISGVPVATSDYISKKVWDVNPNLFTNNETFGSGLGALIRPVYYADVELIQDIAAGEDEYGVQWFRNAIPMVSGQITNPAFSVYNVITGNVLILDRILNYANVYIGALSKTETTLTSSGVPYLVAVSGTIDGATRYWTNVVGKE